MTIRTFQPGDEEAQAAIYNEAAGSLPGFKPASVDEIRRRQRSPAFAADWRFYAVEAGTPVAYIVLNRNGRVSNAWSRVGAQRWTSPLWGAAEAAARKAGLKRIFAAYRGDWTEVAQSLEKHGFVRKREMVNYVIDVSDLPTQSLYRGPVIRCLTPADVPAVLRMGGSLYDGRTPAELESRLFANPYFPAESLFAAAAPAAGEILGCAILIQESGYADPTKVDSAMPCFRLGAFGNEWQDVKRIRGMFSFLTMPDRNVSSVGLDLLSNASRQLHDDIDCIAAQVPSDLIEQVSFYHRLFRRQGSFPVFERELN
jgi:hypothetical protein